MNMILFRPHFVVVFFALQMHEIQLIDEPQLFKEFDRSVNRGAINVRLPFAGSG